MTFEGKTQRVASDKVTLKRIKTYLVILAVLLSSLVFASVWWGWADTIDKIFYDQLLQTQIQDPPADVIVVAIDEYSLGHIGEWPWSRSYHAELIDRLTDAGVKAIGYDIVFAELNPVDVAGDNAFAKAIVRNSKVVLPVYIDRTQLGGQLIEVLPHPMFAEHAHMGHVNTELDNDGIVRRFYQFEGIGNAFWPHFSTVVAELVSDYKQPTLQADANATVSPLINVRRLPRLIPFIGDVGSFQQISFYDVVSGKIPARLFKDRIVFVGATAISLGDLLPTPVTQHGEQMPGVEINATLFEAARNQQYIVRADKLTQAILSVLLVLFIIALIPKVAGRTALLFISLSTVVIFIMQATILTSSNIWLPLASAVIGQWLVYPLWTVLRLDQTLRFLQKELLTLREELGHQSLAKQHQNPQQILLEKVPPMMEILQVPDYQLAINGRLMFDSGNLNRGELKGQESLPDGPGTIDGCFYCKTKSGGDVYLLMIDTQAVAKWSKMKEAYITGFFESEVSNGISKYVGTYDLVIKYLNEVRLSQSELNSARMLFEFCVNEMNDGVIIADEFGEVLFVNRHALSYLSLESFNEHTLVDLLQNIQVHHAGETWGELLFSIIVERGAKEVEVTTQDDAVLLVNLSYLDLSVERSNLIVINLYDITRIREAQRLRNETVDFLSHDMRSPMVSLLALVNQKRSSGEDEAFLKQIEQYANKNLYFAEQFLQLARVESDELIQTYEVDFEAIVQNAIDDVYTQAQQKQVEINQTVSGSEMFWVKGNGELLERAVVNLIGNAIKYGPQAVPIDVALKVHGESLLFTVRDYGDGIPQEQQSLLFAPFQRIRQLRNDKQKGAGLGLRFVDVTVKRHGGDIYFTSQPGRTVFGFTLPLADI